MDFLQIKKTCNDTKFGIDEACLEIISTSATNLTIWAQSVECDQCNAVSVGNVLPNGNLTLLGDSRFPWIFHFTDANDSSIQCGDTFIHLKEHASYGWNLTNDNCSDIYLKDDSLSQPEYLPILGAFMVIFFCSLVWSLGKCLYNSEWLARSWPRGVPFSELQSDLGSPSLVIDNDVTMVRAELSPIRRSQRVNSIDTFRGIAIVIMIFVNYGGGQYWFFKHSAWNGLTVADLVFPWFLWLMGASLALSLRQRLRNSVPRRRLLCAAIRRAVVLVGIGVVLSTADRRKTALERMRYPGVLQRAGVTYLAVAALEIALMTPQPAFQYGRWRSVHDLLDSWRQWAAVAAAASAHALVSLLLPVPGCPTGYLGPGGRHQGSAHENCTGGAVGYVDRLVFGENHMYQHPSCQQIYKTTLPFDPEGLVGTLTAVLTVYLGVHAGRIMMSFTYSTQRIARYALWAVATGALAGLLCCFSKEGGWIPVNKNVWSLSFALALSSMAFAVQAVLCFVVDEKRWWAGTPFTYAGMNSIAIYVGHELTKNMFPWSWQPFYKSHWELLVMNVWGTALWVCIGYLLHRKKMFLVL